MGTNDLSEHLVLFGGGRQADFSDPTGFSNETFVYTPQLFFSVDEWRKLDTLNPSPSPRRQHAQISINETHVAIFGGKERAGSLNDMWIFQLSGSEADDFASAWTQVTYANTGPSAISEHTMHYETSNNCIYVFGGLNAAFRTLADLWRFNLTDNTWTQMASAPVSLREHTMGVVSNTSVVDGQTLKTSFLAAWGGFNGD